jgi:hypothetical protein
MDGGKRHFWTTTEQEVVEFLHEEIFVRFGIP